MKRNPPIPYKEAAPLIGMTEIALRRRMSCGQIDHVRIGNRLFMTERQIEEFLTAHTIKARHPPG